ncbi:hypothetical protein GI374_11995 [Paracoccus sp. S-4012]|uniref:hypothetical protein n=1 Tax=Paracoccus sp. S-4012 TaxID=2665648 RepID=UPI0012B0D704|nr:hypothetical protein [Paracoccus sp. S-4012]MRX51156.1 hypothetical protein [Paracoccus sp. S-4012]
MTQNTIYESAQTMSYIIHVVPLDAFNFGSLPYNPSIPKYPWNWWGGSDPQLNPDGGNWNVNHPDRGPWNKFTIDTSRAFEIQVQDIDSRPDVLDTDTFHREPAEPDCRRSRRLLRVFRLAATS